LTQEARDTLYAESATYTYRRRDIQVPVIGNADDKRRDGMMFLWTIINRTTARTNATIAVIIHQLNNLEAVMTEENSDITAFNTKVRKLLNSYYANKRVTFDEQVLLTNLADAYKTCKDTEFVMYVNRKWQDHIDESNPITSTELMELALKQYQTMLEQSKWCVESKQTKQIMNLTSQIGNLKKWKNEKEKEKKNSNDKQDGEKQFVNGAQWRKKEPEDKEKPMKRVKNTWYWCTYHKLWQKHQVKDCRLNPANKRAGNDNQQSNSGKEDKVSKGDKNQKDREQEKSEVKYSPKSAIACSPHTTFELHDDF
jgi:hypothetical protein